MRKHCLFCQKNVRSFCCAKALHIFSAKILAHLFLPVLEDLNSLLMIFVKFTNDFVKLTAFFQQLGPEFLEIVLQCTM